MIRLNNITKYYHSTKGRQYVFKDLSFDIPSGHNIALLGANGAGKSTLFKIIAGSDYPNRGNVQTDLSISWPVALSTGIHQHMTGRENTRFIGRINGIADLASYEKRVKDFAELGNKYDLPVSTYSSGMKPRLAFACSIAIDFDVYLIDEVTSVGDAKFRKKAKEALVNKSKSANVIMVSHQMDELQQFCDSAIVLQDGELTFYNDLEEAIKKYQQYNPDIILMDIQMPIMSGYEATQKIRSLQKSNHHTPIIALTAGTVKGEKDRCLTLGMDNYLSKPIQIEAFSTMIKKYFLKSI